MQALFPAVLISAVLVICGWLVQGSIDPHAQPPLGGHVVSSTTTR